MDVATPPKVQTCGPADLQACLLIGLMSGTSVDGIDAALVEMASSAPRITTRAFLCRPWPEGLRRRILDLCRPDAPLREALLLSFRIAEEFAAAARDVAALAGVSLADVQAIASHGQTVRHEPDPVDVEGLAVRATLQIGEPAVIAARTGCVVVADFRPADVAAGGSGAPLVPAADLIMFRHETEWRAVLNVGGIANVTLVPPSSRPDVEPLAFDTGPGNMVIDGVVDRITNGARRFDSGGEMAARGAPCEPLLSELLTDPWFAAPPPKSTGRERFGEEYVRRVCARGRELRCSEEDLAATVTALTADSIAHAIGSWLEPIHPIDRLILAGGGAHNAVLVSRLRESVAPAALSLSSEFGVDVDAREAVAFAVLGRLTLEGRAGNLPSATGASRPAVLGKICYPPRT
jgi:anhydro-N-acetylmuramic acid kinase